jgi:hypothetical protein
VVFLLPVKIIDISKQVDDGKKRIRDFSAVDTIAVHRVGWILKRDGSLSSKIGDTAEEICEAFTSNPEVSKYTGGEIAYTLMVERDGTIKQCLPVDEIGAHARRWNKQAIGVACIGDFRHEEMGPDQRSALEDLLTLLCLSFNLDPLRAIRGHDELPGGSANPEKRCPGNRLIMGDLRRSVKALIQERGREELTEAGLSWSS